MNHPPYLLKTQVNFISNQKILIAYFLNESFKSYFLNVLYIFSDDNIPSNLENNKGVATKHNGKTVRFQTEAGDPSNNDNDPIDEGKDKKETNR